MLNQQAPGTDTIARIGLAIAEHRLPAEFESAVVDYYLPLARQLYSDIKSARIDSELPVQFVGIQGSQGSGKSTCADFLKILLQAEFGLRVLVTSIDDFYLTLKEREEQASSVHPLFITRGVPGTHDVAMIHSMFDCALKGQDFTVPIFNKADDNRAPQTEWQHVQESLDVVILEGWCVGLSAQDRASLSQPVNQLESLEDTSGEWRGHINHVLDSEYRALFDRLDYLVAIQAPSFACVYDWRLLQEQKMIKRLAEQGGEVSGAQSPAQLKRFIAQYQRLTEHALKTMPLQADYLLWLNRNHEFIKLERRPH